MCTSGTKVIQGTRPAVTQMQPSGLGFILVFLFPAGIKQIGVRDEVATGSSGTLLTSGDLGHGLQWGQSPFLCNPTENPVSQIDLF